MSQQAKSSPHSLMRGATKSSLLGRFFRALRFMVAVIFKGPHRALSVPRGVFSNRALASVSLYLVGEGFVMGVRSGSHW
jgi:hypothetical protein